jgi:hypothetical protein
MTRSTVILKSIRQSRVTEGVVGVEIGSMSLVTEGVIEFTQRFVMFKCVQNAQKSAMLEVFKVNVSKFWHVSREISWGVELSNWFKWSRVTPPVELNLKLQ